MLDRHLPRLGVGFWVALCFASVFGANMGDFFAHDLGLGHARGLPLLALLFLAIVTLERFDPSTHAAWYWAAIVVIRTAATNIGDLLTLDWHLPPLAVMAALALLLAAAAVLVAAEGAEAWPATVTTQRSPRPWPGAVVHAGRRVPAGQLWSGNPAVFERDLTKSEMANDEGNAAAEAEVAAEHAAEFAVEGGEAARRALA